MTRHNVDKPPADGIIEETDAPLSHTPSSVGETSRPRAAGASTLPLRPAPTPTTLIQAEMTSDEWAKIVGLIRGLVRQAAERNVDIAGLGEIGDRLRQQVDWEGYEAELMDPSFWSSEAEEVIPTAGPQGIGAVVHVRLSPDELTRVRHVMRRVGATRLTSFAHDALLTRVSILEASSDDLAD